MKPTIKQYFGLFNTDDRGYEQGEPIEIAPFAGAFASVSAYQSVSKLNILKFEDVNYIVESEIRSPILGNFKAFEPVDAFYIYIYDNGFDKSIYIVGEHELLNYINKNKGEIVPSIRKVVIIQDDEGGFYKLKNKNVVVIKPFVMSREMAIKNALEKLTTEDKKLLGLI